MGSEQGIFACPLVTCKSSETTVPKLIAGKLATQTCERSTVCVGNDFMSLCAKMLTCWKKPKSRSKLEKLILIDGNFSFFSGNQSSVFWSCFQVLAKMFESFQKLSNRCGFLKVVKSN